MSETRDDLSIRIDNLLLGLPLSPWRPSIFKVNDDICGPNKKLYDPKVVSFGPIHHGRDHLQKMEHHKLRYLNLLLKWRKESSVYNYVEAIRSIEQKVRSCYADPVELTSDQFVEMLLLDGCFIIELIRKYGLDELRERDDPIFQYEQVLSQLRHDLMLVENQVPFFVIDQLFSMTKSGDPDDDIQYLVQLFAADISPWPAVVEAPGKVSKNNVDHLLGLMHKTWFSSFEMMLANKPAVKSEEEATVSINSATELREAGIKFQNYAGSSCLDINFTKGVVRIPGFNVSDETEPILSNLIAYEHFFVDNHPKYVTDYAYFLHCLINSSKDVETLRLRGILSNLLGDDEMVYHMFNRLGRNMLMSCDFSYAYACNKVRIHCKHRRNRWMANLRSNYFNSPWAYISFFAALLLLFFTFIQTLFSVLSYVKFK